MRIFIAGTDTGIGKTHVACTLLHALRRDGYVACGMKPVASGCIDSPEGLRNADALALLAAGSKPLPYACVNPYALRDPIAPHLAALRDGVTLSMPPIEDAFDALCNEHGAVVVEGVGGWRVPLAPGFFASDIPKDWQLPVILVVGLRLGCLSHAMLSAEAIVADGCHLRGWIGNHIDPDMAALSENIDTLRESLSAPCLGILPYETEPAMAANMLDLTLWKHHLST